MLYLASGNITQKWTQGYGNCDQVLSQLIILYDERLTQVDFVAQRQGEKLYVQVTQEIRSEKTERREYDRLLEIRDNYQKHARCGFPSE